MKLLGYIYKIIKAVLNICQDDEHKDIPNGFDDSNNLEHYN